VAQGGDPLTRGIRDKDWTTNTRIAYSKGIPLAGTGGPGYTIKAEFNNLHHEPGTLAMARSQDPDSAGSQFYICLAPQPHLDGNYTVFGKVTDGMDVVLALQVGDEIQSISVYPVEPVVTPVTVNAVNNNQ
jgi:cyclophilin family peptidyl-prolyl cis-trans isomerase